MQISKVIDNLIKQDEYCPICGEKMEIVGEKTIDILGKVKRFYIFNCKNDCEVKNERNKEYSKRYKKAKECWNSVGFSRECVGWNLDKLTCENIDYLRDYAKNFTKFSKALVLNGNKGTGKSLSSECIAKYLTKKGYNIRITNMTEINIEMNRALRKDEYTQYLNNLLKIDLIVIDDFGREQYTTEKSLENVFQFFNTLIKEHKPFIVSLNPEILSIISQKPQLDACIDRFKNSKRVKILEFVKDSFRK